MPLFYFEINDGGPPIPCVGEELASLEAARAHAFQYAGQMMCDDRQRWDAQDWIMTVTDAARLTLFTIVVAVFHAAAALGVRPKATA